MKKQQLMSGEYAICSRYEKCTPGLYDKNFVKHMCKPSIDSKNYTMMTFVLRKLRFFLITTCAFVVTVYTIISSKLVAGIKN